MSADERARLRALAERATAGPWSVSEPIEKDDHMEWDVEAPHASGIPSIAVTCFEEHDAAFIAAANPAAVLALLAAVEEAEQRAAEAEQRIADALALMNDAGPHLVGEMYDAQGANQAHRVLAGGATPRHTRMALPPGYPENTEF